MGNIRSTLMHMAQQMSVNRFYRATNCQTDYYARDASVTVDILSGQYLCGEGVGSP